MIYSLIHSCRVARNRLFGRFVKTIFQCACPPLSEVTCLVLWLKFFLDLPLTWANSTGSGETGRMPSFAWTFAVRIYYDGPFKMVRSLRGHFIINEQCSTAVWFHHWIIIEQEHGKIIKMPSSSSKYTSLLPMHAIWTSRLFWATLIPKTETPIVRILRIRDRASRFISMHGTVRGFFSSLAETFWTYRWSTNTMARYKINM